MFIDDLRANFPEGVAAPDELVALCAFAEDNGEISGAFELETDGWDSAVSWFGGDEEAASRFAVFGRGPDGALYAFWLHAGSDASPAPIALLDSEFTESALIASNMHEFLRLLAIGYDEPGKYPELEPDNPDTAADFREWLKKEYEVTPPETGEAIVAAAHSVQPDLKTWLKKWQEDHSS